MSGLLIYKKSSEYTAIHKSFISAFDELGLTVSTYEADQLFSNKILNKIYFLFFSNLYNKIQSSKIFKDLYQVKDQIEFIFIIKGSFIEPSLLKRIKRTFPNIQLVCFNPDDPFNSASSNQNIVSAIPFYDRYFIWKRELLGLIKKQGAKSVDYLPFATDKTRIFPITNGLPKYELSFIGNGDKERHYWVYNILQKIIDNNLNIKFHVFGHNWEKKKNLFLEGQKIKNAYLETIGSSLINLNLLRKQNKNAINMRTFEIPAAGGFMLHEFSDAAMEFFKPDIEAVYFSSIEELLDKSIFFLKNDALREKIRNKGFEAATSINYSYKNRMKMVLSTLNKH